MYLFNEVLFVGRVSSPLNYTGGKFRLLPQITSLFPENIRFFIDLFCGGCNVGANVPAEKVFFNDNNAVLVGLLKTFHKIKANELIHRIERFIQQYELSDSSKYGYEYYGANGADGLANYNREAFLKMRDDFNALTEQDEEYFIRLYVLILFAFNNQLRFNRDGKYNLPVGKRDFNIPMRKKLLAFLERIQDKRYLFSCVDFRDWDYTQLTREDLVYVDPPYLITCASYNEQNGWNEKDERDLLDFLDNLHRSDIRFALSNVLKSKGKENSLLQTWISHHSKEYTVHALNYHYANSNYQTKDRSFSSEEVLIVNY
ncbi:MAG: DNA adenine methylase [Planctomycetia bacterium]|nr:DNA adenine methylase [Planctomycetia bacterium]